MPFLLHIGIFIIWIPAVMLNQRQRKGFLDRTPAWMKNTLAVLGAYAIQEGFPPGLSEEVREITITGVDTKALDHQGLNKSQGDDF